MPIGIFSQSFPPKSLYSEADIPDLTNKVVIVTGSNVGIGYETARVLLTKGAKVYVACRSEEKASAAIVSLKESTGKDAHFLKLDLGDIKASKAAATEFLTKEERLDILFLNAGVMMPAAGSVTSDGYELQWGTNCLGHYVFTEALIPTLISTAATSPANSVRIITTSSSAHMYATKGGIDLENQASSKMMALYGQSKLGNVIQSQYWADKLRDSGVIALSLNPGNIKTELARSMPGFVRSLGQIILHDVSKGAITQLYGGTSPAITIEQTGGYLVPWARLDVPARPEAHDKAFCEKVMALMQKQTDEKLQSV